MRFSALFAAFFTFSAPLFAQTDPQLAAQGLFPFALPPFDSTHNATDVSFLNPEPAGAHGFVGVSGENFVDGAGNPLRLWGVNLNFLGAFPTKDDAPRLAARLAKFGFNAVRFHHYEGNAAPNGLWKAAAIGSTRLALPRQIDPEQQDRLDFFAAELMKRGIYCDWNLHVARKVLESEGFPNAQLLPEKDKGVAAFFAPLEEEQKRHFREFLTRINPYTGHALKDEPGVCAVEVANENSLLALWLDGTLSKLPPPYSDTLRLQWNDWLLKKYGSNEALKRAWTELDEPLGQNELLNGNAPAPAQNPDEPVVLGADDGGNGEAGELRSWKLATVGNATGQTDVDEMGGPTADGFLRAGLSAQLLTPGNVSWAFQLNREGLNWRDGQAYTFSFWARADANRRISVNTWNDSKPNRFLGFTGYADLSTQWQKFSFVFRVVGSEGGGRLSLNLGNSVGTVQMGAVSLREGGTIAAPEDWNLRVGVPLLEQKTTPIFAARRDFAQFLGETEIAYAARMRKFLKEEIGLKFPIWHTQAQFGAWGGVLRESQSDALDIHAYWKHPDFGGGGWSGTSWKVENASMTGAAGTDPLSGLALCRIAGKPFVLSEWNSGQPNDFGGESLLLAASFAAQQNWAGVWMFDFHSSGSYDRDHFEGFFSIDSHPVKMATAPLAALLFRRPDGPKLGDIAPLESQTTLDFPRDWVWSEAANSPGTPSPVPFIRSWTGAGAPRAAGLESRVGVGFSDGLFPTPTWAETNGVGIYKTSQTVWDGKNSLWSADTPKSKSFAGFWGGQWMNLGELRVFFAPSPNNFATGGLTSLDGLPVAQSKKMLFVLAGRVENPGMNWNAERNSVGNQWGRGPTHVQGIEAAIRLNSDHSNLKVWALDESGNRKQEVPSKFENGVLKWNAIAQWQTIWFELAAE